MFDGASGKPSDRKGIDSSYNKGSVDTEWGNNSDDSVLMSLLKDGFKEGKRNGLRELHTENGTVRKDRGKESHNIIE